MLIHDPLSFFYCNSSDTDHFSRSVKFPVLGISDPLKSDCVFQRSSKKTNYSYINMYDIDIALSWEFKELIARESETILLLFFSYSFLSSSLLFGIKIYKIFHGSPIINAVLLRDLTLWVSHDHYHR